MLIDVWEVYKRDSQECCMFLTKELAENQTVFDETDLISQSTVNVTDDQYHELKRGKAVWQHITPLFTGQSRAMLCYIHKFGD